MPTRHFRTCTLCEAMCGLELEVADGRVTSIRPLKECGIWINAGYFAFRKEIFEHIREGDELVEKPFQRLANKGLLMAHKHEGFWMAMDTFKDKQVLDEMVARNDVPWEVWKKTS